MTYLLHGVNSTILISVLITLAKDKRKDSKILLLYLLSFFVVNHLIFFGSDVIVIDVASLVTAFSGVWFLTSLINSLSVAKYIQK